MRLILNWQLLFKPIIAALLGRHRLQFYESIDWEQACIPFRQNDLAYPPYYDRNFHGIIGGYLNPIAAMTYDPVTAWASPPNEGLLRRQLINAIVGKPARILDLGCGTGSLALMLKTVKILEPIVRREI